MIPKCLGGLRIKLHLIRCGGEKGTGNDAENRRELVLGEDVAHSEHRYGGAIDFKEAKLGGSTLAAFLCFMYSRDSHIHWGFVSFCLKLPTIEISFI